MSIYRFGVDPEAVSGSFCNDHILTTAGINGITELGDVEVQRPDAALTVVSL